MKNSVFVSSVLVGEGFKQKKIRVFVCSQFRIILQDVNTTIGRIPEIYPIAAKPLEASGEAASIYI